MISTARLVISSPPARSPGSATPCQEQVGPKQARSRSGRHPNFTGGARTRYAGRDDSIR